MNNWYLAISPLHMLRYIFGSRSGRGGIVYTVSVRDIKVRLGGLSRNKTL